MYEAFFGLNERPFSLTPNPRYIYYSQRYREAEDQLMYALGHGEGFMLVTGQPGTGKTTLCRDLLGKLDRNTIRSALLFNPFLNGVEMLAALLSEFGVVHEANESRKVLLDRLNQFLLAQLRDGYHCVAIFDEAQHLSAEFLEQIRVLSNLETDSEKLIQIILVGQPELLERIRTPAMAQLDQRVSVRCALTHLNAQETDRYIQHRLNIAGARGRIMISESAGKAIHAASGGVPRVINLIADRALLAAYVAQTREIREEQVTRALTALRGEEGNLSTLEVAASAGLLRHPRRHRRIIAAAAIGAAVVIAAIGASRLRAAPSADALFASALNAPAPSAESLYQRISNEFPASQQAEASLMRLIELAISRDQRTAALQQIDRLHQRFPESRFTPLLALDKARLQLANADTASACSIKTPSLAAGDTGMMKERARIASVCAARDSARVAGTRVDSTNRVDSMAQITHSSVVAPSAQGQGSRGTEGFAIQLGAYGDSAEAFASASALSRRGLPARVIASGHSFHLRLGHYATLEQARLGARALAARALPGVVVSESSP